MTPIPPKLRQEMADDLFYKQCCITGKTDEKIEWHHSYRFAGKNVQEKWRILPLAKSVHDNITYYQEQCEHIMLNRADEATLKKYSKAVDLIRKRDYLNKKYEKN